MVSYHGGSYSRRLDSKCTHLITHRPKGQKYLNRNKVRNLISVTPGWILASVRKKSLANIADYDPANVIDTGSKIETGSETGSQPETPNPTKRQTKTTRKKKTQNSIKSPKIDNIDSLTTFCIDF